MPFKRLVLYAAPFALLWGTAHAACGPVPAGNNDLGISFLQAGGTQIAPVGQLASSVARGVVVYDASDNRLKLCDGTDWVTVGAGGGGGAVGGLGEVQFSDGAGALSSSPMFRVQNNTLELDGSLAMTWTMVGGTNTDDERKLRFHGTAFGDGTSGYKLSWRNADGSVRREMMSFSKDGRVRIGSSQNASDSAIFAVTGVDGGFLPPRISTANRGSIATPVSGLMIYNISLNALQVYNGTEWVSLGTSGGGGGGAPAQGDVGAVQLSDGAGAFTSKDGLQWVTSGIAEKLRMPGGIDMTRSLGDAWGTRLGFFKNRGGAGVVQDQDELGFIDFLGGVPDGAAARGALVLARVDGTATATSVPGQLEFRTTRQGATDAVNRMVIRNDGRIGIGLSNPQAQLSVQQSGATPASYTAEFINSGSMAGVGGVLFSQDSSHAYKWYTHGTGSLTGGLAVDYIKRDDGSAVHEKILTMRSGNVGIGKDYAAYKLDVAGAVNATSVLVNGVPVATSTDTYWEPASAGRIYYSGGHVGIGTNAPASPLHLATAAVANVVPDSGLYNVSDSILLAGANINSLRFITATGMPDAAGQVVALRMRGTLDAPQAVQAEDRLMVLYAQGYDGSARANSTAIIMNADGAPSAGHVPGRITFWTDDGANYAERMRITSGGRVGVGVAVPETVLDVQLDNNSTSRYLQLRDGDSAGRLRIGDGTAGAGQMLPMLIGESIGAARYSAFLGQVRGADDTGKVPSVVIVGRQFDGDATYARLVNRPVMSVRNHDTDYLFVAADGNIGVGTDTPLEAMHISNARRATLYIDGNTGGGTQAMGATVQLNSNADGRGRGLVMSASDNSVSWFAGVPYGGGGYQIGSSPLQGMASNGATYKENARLFISSNTNFMGVGTITPRAMLDVAGGVKLGNDTDVCPGTANAKLGTLRFTGAALQICESGGWAAAGGSSAAAAGANGQVQYNDGAGAFAASSALTWNNSTGVLQVNGAAADTRVHVGNLASQYTAMTNNSVGFNSTDAQAYINQSGIGAKIGFRLSNAAVRDTTVMTLQPNGFVGIGTTGPASMLTVNGGTIRLTGDQPEVWSLNGWRKGLVMDMARAIVWERGDTGVARGIGASSNGVFYITRSDGNDSSGSSNYDMVVSAIGNVGIGDTSPAYKLTVDTSAHTPLLIRRPGANLNVNYAAENDSGISYFGRPASGGLFGVASNPNLTTGNALYIGGDNNVGIGTTSPAQKLHVHAGHIRVSGASNGSAAAAYVEFTGANGTRTGYVGDGSSSNSTIYITADAGNIQATGVGGSCVVNTGACTSDARLKQDIDDIGSVLAKLDKVRGVSYRWKAHPEQEYYGVIAQEVQAQFPALVEADEDTGMLQVNYNGLTAPLINAVKELKAENDALKAENAAFRARLDAIEARLGPE